MTNGFSEVKPINVCVLCGANDDPCSFYISLNGAGPFCSECWSDLTDADSTLAMQKELAAREQKIDELMREIEELRK
jgi:recombinational DNA repair protein (RecF pathway)